MRLMSFQLTTEQVRNRTKTVTRRLGWRFLKPGTLLQPVVKCQGIPKGEKVEKIGHPIRVVSIERAPLNAISPQDVYREGFPPMTAPEFVRMFKKTHKGCRVNTVVTRIEFSYAICVHCYVPIAGTGPGLCGECACEDDSAIW